MVSEENIIRITVMEHIRPPPELDFPRQMDLKNVEMGADQLYLTIAMNSRTDAEQCFSVYH